jgi:hypothetical protein
LLIDWAVHAQREVFEPPELPNHREGPKGKPPEACGGGESRGGEEKVVEYVSKEDHGEP